MAGPYDINFGATNTGAQNVQGNYFQGMGGQTTQGVMAPGMNLQGVQAPAMQQTGAGTGLGFNLGTGQLVLGAIGTLGNLWSAFQAQKLAKEQFDFQKGVTNTNLANQIQSYNTSLVDRINARSFMQGDSQETTNAYIAANSLKDERKK